MDLVNMSQDELRRWVIDNPTDAQRLIADLNRAFAPVREALLEVADRYRRFGVVASERFADTPEFQRLLELRR